MINRRNILHHAGHGERLRACETPFLIHHLRDHWRAITPLVDDRDWSPLFTHLLEPDRTTTGSLKNSTASRVRRIEIGTADERINVVGKEGRPRTWLQRIGTYFKGPKEWRQFWLGYELLAAGLTTPKPLACLWRRNGTLSFEGKLITEHLGQALPLDRAIRRLCARQLPGRDTLRTLLAETVVLICRLGKCGYYHRDLKVSNILVTAHDRAPAVWLIDLDGVATDTRAFGSGFQQSMIRLAASLAETTQLSLVDWRRLLDAYMSQRAAPGSDWKSIWRRLQRGVAAFQRNKRPHGLEATG